MCAALVGLFALMLGGCALGGKNMSDTPIDKIPKSYTLDDAKKDGCVVFEDMRLTSGGSVWENFVEKTEKGRPAKVRLAKYYTLNDPSRYSPELYEKIKDDYSQSGDWIDFAWVYGDFQ